MATPQPQPTHAHQPPLRGDLPRTLYLLRLMRLCVFPLVTVVLGNVILLAVPQAREALQGQAGYDRFDLQDVLVSAAHLYWIGMAWYTARLLVDRRFSPDTVGVCSDPRFSQRVVRWLPRLLVLLGGLPLAVLFIFTPGLRSLGVVLTVLTALFFYFVVMRRHWLDRLSPHSTWWSGMRQATESRRSLDADDPRITGTAVHTQWFVATWLTVSLAMMLAIWLGMEGVARVFGSPSLVLIALASWTLFGGIVLTYLPKAYGHPALNWAPVVAFVACSFFNENHPVAQPGAAQAAVNGERPVLALAFTSWLAQRRDPQAPVILVASAGGASRAAYWGTSALGKLEDEARAAGKPFADNIFLISGVSGGSLGAATFVASVDATRQTPGASVRQSGNAFTGRDHLSTVVGYLLYPDLVQRFLPVPINAWDRSRALEEVWERDWQALHPTGPNPWHEPFSALQQRSKPGAPLPWLALNTSAMAQGLRVFQSDFRLPGSDGIDLLATPGLDTRHLTLAQAVHNSARFPFLSPVGAVKLSDGGAVWDRLGDGGYVEASGALTVLEVLRTLTQLNLVRDCGSSACPGPGRGTAWVDLHSQVRVLLLDNAPALGQEWRCQRSDHGVSQATPDVKQHDMLMADLLGPVVGLAQGRSGRGDIATHDLIATTGGCENVAEVRLPKAPKLPEPSMNWMLNEASREQIDKALDGRPEQATKANCQLERHLAQVRSWVGLPPAPAQTCALAS